MRIDGIQLAQGSNISNLVVASGTLSFPSSPDEGELYFRADSAANVRGLYAYINGNWDRIGSADSLTVPVGSSFPATANAGDLFYKDTNDSLEGLYVYNGSAWGAVVSGSNSYTISGDVSGTIDGGTDALTLATVNAGPGSFGSSSDTVLLTINGKGLVTSSSATPIAIAASQVTTGTFVDGRIAQSNVTQHQAALTIAESQITDGAILARVGGSETITGTWTFNNNIVGSITGSAPTLTTGRTIGITGDATWTSPSFNGSANVTAALTLATVNASPATYGSASAVPVFAVNAKGLVTSVTNTNISIASTAVSDFTEAVQDVVGAFASGADSVSVTYSDVANTLTIGLGNVGTAGTYGSASSVAVVTTDAQGRVSGATTTAIAIPTSAVTSGTFADARIAQSNVTQHQAALTITESQITDGTLLARVAGNETISGTWQFNNAVTGVDPTTSSHLTTKNYVDNALLGLTWKHPVRVATTANITLSGTQTVDGIALVAGDRVLVKDQSTGSQNGVYVVAAGAWTRATDFDQTAPLDEVNSAAVFVSLGTVNADTGWTQTAAITTVGTDAMVFVQFSAGGSYTAGAGLSQSGNAFNVGTASTSRIVVNADTIDLATVTDSGTGSFLKLATDTYGRVTGTTAVTTADITGLANGTYVNTSGDTMTGDLILDNAVYLRSKTAGAVSTRILGLNASDLLYIGGIDTAISGILFANNGVETARLTTTGFGIGMVPVNKMDVYQSTNAGVKLQVLNDNAGAGAQTVISASNGTNDMGMIMHGTGHASTAFGTIYITGAKDLGFQTNTTEKMRITAGGQLLVGATSAFASEQILAAKSAAGTTTGFLALLNTGTTTGTGTAINFGTNTNSGAAVALGSIAVQSTDAVGAGDMIFTTRSTSATEKMRITGPGNVGIATALPQVAVQLGGDSNYRELRLTRSVDSANAQAQVFYKARGTESVPTIVSSGDTLGSVIFAGNDGTGASATAVIQAAAISAAVDGTPGTADMPGRLSFSTTSDGTSAVVERVRIDSAGRMNVGTTPASTVATGINLVNAANSTFGLFYLKDTTAASTTAQPGISLQRDGSGSGFVSPSLFFDVGSGGGNASLHTIREGGPGGNLIISTDTTSGVLTERMRIDSAGNVGIGKTPAEIFEVLAANGRAHFYLETTSAGNTAAIRLTSTAGSAQWQMSAGTSSTNNLSFASTAAGESMRLTTTNVLMGTTVAQSVAGGSRLLQLEGGTTAGLSIVRNSADALQPVISLGKSRGATAGSVTIVQSGDTLGSIKFGGADGSTLLGTSAEIAAIVDGTPGAGDVPGRLVFSTAPDGTVTPVERMRIDSNGLITVGTVSCINLSQNIIGTDVAASKKVLVTFPATATAFNAVVTIQSDRATNDSSSANSFFARYNIVRGGGSTGSFAYFAVTAAEEQFSSAFTSPIWYFDTTSGNAYVRFSQTGNSYTFSVGIELAGATGVVPTIAVDAGTAPTGSVVSPWYSFNGLANTLIASTAGTERMRIDSAGNLGIGTTTMTSKVNIAGSVNLTAGGTIIANGATAGTGIFRAASSAGGASILSTEPTSTTAFTDFDFVPQTATTDSGVLRVFRGSDVAAATSHVAIYAPNTATRRIGLFADGTISTSTDANAPMSISATNSNAGTGADARVVVSNGTNSGGIIMRGTGFTTIAGEANAMITYVNGSNPLLFYANGVERARIDSVGLGVGGAAANRPIELFNSTRGLIRASATATTGTDAVSGIEMFAYDGSAVTTGASIVLNYSLQASDPNALVLATSRAAAPMIFKTAGTERTRIDGTGDILHAGQINLSRGGNSTIARNNTSGYLSLSGGNGLNDGPNIQLGGSTSATFANLMVFRNGTSNLGVFTSGGSLVISPTATTPTGSEKLLVSTTNAGSSATLAVLQNLGTTVGTGVSLNFATATNGGAGVTLGGINMVAVGAVTTGNAAGDMAFSTTAAAAASEKMRLTSAGYLMVGSASATTARAVEIAGGNTSGSTNIVNIETVSANQYSGLTIVRNDNTTAQLGATINLARTRGAANGAVTVVTTGDTLGGIAFSGADGTDIRTNAAEILAMAEGTVGANVMPGRLVFSTTAAGGATPTERMRIDSSGNVSINGVPGAASKLSSTAADGTYLLALVGTTKAARFVTDSAAFRMTAVDNTLSATYQPLQLGGSTVTIQRNGTTPALTVSAAGNVGISTPDASTIALSINANASAIPAVQIAGNTTAFASADIRTSRTGTESASVGTGASIQLDNTTASTGVLMQNTGGALQFFNTTNLSSWTERMRMDATGALLIGTGTTRVLTSTAPMRLQVETIDNNAGVSVTRNTADTAGPNYRLYKTRGTAVNTNTVVVSGDSLGQLQWFGADGTGPIPAAEIRAEVDATPGTNDMPGRLTFHTTADGAATVTERMRIDSSGHLLVGGTSFVASVYAGSPANTAISAFDTAASSAAILLMRNDASNAAATSLLSLGRSRSATAGAHTVVTVGDTLGAVNFVGSDGSAFKEAAKIIAQSDTGTPSATSMAGRLAFYTTPNASVTPAERMRIDSSGNVVVTGSGGLGYGTGSGGAVTQATSRTTGVTLNKTNGAITLVSAAGTATWQSFTVTNSTVAATDVIRVCQQTGTDLYQIHVTAVAAGSFRISFATTGGTTTETPVFNFAVIKAVTA